MVEIQCPSCEADIELEDGVFGLFDCPLCGEEFSWDDDEESFDEEITQPEDPLGLMILKLIVKYGLLLSVAVFLIAIISGVIILITDGGMMIFLSFWLAIAAGYIFLGTIIVGFIGLLIFTIVESSNRHINK